MPSAMLGPHPRSFFFPYPRTTVGKAANWEECVYALAQAHPGELQCSVLLLNSCGTLDKLSNHSPLFSSGSGVIIPYQIGLSLFEHEIGNGAVILVLHSPAKQMKLPLEHPPRFSYALCPFFSSPPLSATNNVMDASQTPGASPYPLNLFAFYSKNCCKLWNKSPCVFPPTPWSRTQLTLNLRDSLEKEKYITVRWQHSGRCSSSLIAWF